MSTDDPRISEAELAADDAACDEFESEAAYEADNETAVQAAEFDLAKFRQEAIAAYELLSQDKIWVDIHGRVHSIDAMSVRYKVNCLEFIRKRVAFFAARYPWGAIYAMDLPSGLAELGPLGDDGQPTAGRSVPRSAVMLDDGGNMSAAFDEYIDSIIDAIREDQVRWLDETPLMRALSAQVLAGEGGAVGERPEDAPRECPPGERCGKCGKAAHIRAVHRRNSAGLVRLCTGEWVRFRSRARV